jgi:hypothetical protein
VCVCVCGVPLSRPARCGAWRAAPTESVFVLHPSSAAAPAQPKRTHAPSHPCIPSVRISERARSPQWQCVKATWTGIPLRYHCNNSCNSSPRDSNETENFQNPRHTRRALYSRRGGGRGSAPPTVPLLLLAARCVLGHTHQRNIDPTHTVRGTVHGRGRGV